MPIKDRPLVDRHAPKNGVGWEKSSGEPRTKTVRLKKILFSHRMKLFALLGALFIASPSIHSQTLDDMQRRMQQFCNYDIDLCVYMQERSAIIEMCGAIVLNEYDVFSLNMHIRRNLIWSRNEISRLAAESAKTYCESLGVEGVRLESSEIIEHLKKN